MNAANPSRPALSAPPAEDVREALDGDVKALMGRLWAAADNAGVSRSAVEFEWPECHKPKCQVPHGRPDIAMSYMKRAIMAEIAAELRYRSTTRPDRAPDENSPAQAAAFNLAILLRTHNVHDEGTFARAAERIVEAYPELIPVLSAVVRPRGTVTDAEVGAAARALFEDPMVTGDGYTWAEMVADDPSRADIWRAEARRILEAAAGVVSAGPGPTVPAPAAPTEAEVPDVPGFEGTRGALDGLIIRGGESS